MAPKDDPPPPIARRFIWYVSSFMVSIGVGLAPFLGLAKVPGFRALLDLFPLQLQDDLIPLSAFLMGLVAIGIQFYSTERVKRVSIRRWFRKGFLYTLGLLFFLLIAYKIFVVRILIPDADRTVAVLVGWTSPEDTDCCRGEKSTSACIEKISVDPVVIESCWGDREISVGGLLLALPYLAITGGIGALIGLIIVKEQMLRQDRSRESRTSSKEKDEESQAT